MNAGVHEPGFGNIIFAWVWFLGGALSGMTLGLFFQNETWLGGYGSFRRRLYRLAHISFFGLGLLNFLYGLTLSQFDLPDYPVTSRLFMISGVTMPLVCIGMAHSRHVHALFAVPVGTLLTAIVLTLATLL